MRNFTEQENNLIKELVALPQITLTSVSGAYSLKISNTLIFSGLLAKEEFFNCVVQCLCIQCFNVFHFYSS